MRIKQLLEEAYNWLEDHQYTKTTIYHNYVRHWNEFSKSTGKEVLQLRGRHTLQGIDPA